MKADKTTLRPDSIEQLADVLLAQARSSHQRRVLLLAGERAWAIGQAQRALAATELLAGAGWLGDLAPDAITPVAPSRVSRLLGRELPALVVDAYAGFDPDAVGAAIGALRGGGPLLLLTPPLAQWAEYPDPQHERIAVAPYRPEDVSGRFLGRLARILAESADVVRVEQERPLPRLPAGTDAAAPAVAAVAPYATEDQRLAVEALHRVALGRARRPLLLIADRGRGKSAAFGIAAAELLAMEPKRILLTGPRLDAVQAVFEHATRLLPEARRQPDALLREDGGWLRFIAPDALALERPDADLVLVDEAAALPVPLLTRLLRQYPRIAFATTVHGYEGTGRGFLLRFVRILKEQAPGWRRLRLEAPIRWTPEDPLERLSFRLLLLDAEAVAEDELVAAERLRIERLDRDALAGDEARLSQLFGLLLQAHYRTRPFDLRHLLDGPNVEVYAQFSGKHVVGAALVVVEGGLDEAIGGVIVRGERRLRGHLIPQSLAFHLGLVEGVSLRCARIMRLAVHPAWQRRGLGSRLVAALVADAAERGLDLAGSSFGGDASLLRFWQRCGFLPVRVGMTRSSNSGEHALMLLRGLSEPGQALRNEARRRFLRDLPDQLTQPLRGLEPLLAIRLLEGKERSHEAPDAVDREQLTAFAFGRRSYGDSLGALRRFVLHMCTRQDVLECVPAQRLELLAAAVLQGRGWSETAALGGLTGRNDAMQAVRETLAQLIGEPHESG